MIYLILIAAAAAVAFWPSQAIIGGSQSKLFAPAKEEKTQHTYMKAIDSLAYCRARLAATDALDDKAKSAIDVITLALVSGSDK